MHKTILLPAFMAFAVSPGSSKSRIKVKNKKHPTILRVKEAIELEREGPRRR